MRDGLDLTRIESLIAEYEQLHIRQERIIQNYEERLARVTQLETDVSGRAKKRAKKASKR